METVEAVKLVWRVAFLLVAVGVVGGFVLTQTMKASGAGPVPAPFVDDAMGNKPSKAKAVFAGGCFWGTQAVFERLKGVVDTTVGAIQADRPQRQPTTN